ncbi:PQQ-binding-like beta-propeller repeat protein [Bacteroidota bacterium]
MKRSALIFLCIVILIGSIQAQNPSQWRGAERNGSYNEEMLLKKWPDNGPEKLWSILGIGEGYSSATVTEKIVFITGLVDTLEVMSAFDLEGNLKWKTAYGNGWIESFPGARATPTYENGKVYIISGTGEIVCLNGENGEILWKVDGYKKFEGICTMWGTNESPLIVDDKIIYTAGGKMTTMVALNKHTGETIWKSESLQDSTAYVSPLLIENGGRKIISSILANTFFGIDAENGELLWKYDYFSLKWRQDHWYSPIINCNTPIYNDGQIFISKGYDHKAAMFALEEDGTGIELMWTDTILDVHIGGMVQKDNYLYGANWIHNRDGNWCCLDWKTGELMYEEKWQNKGSIILADDLMYCYEEKDGHIALVEPTPTEFKVISSFQVDEGKGPYWAHPVIHNGVLYIRHGEVLMAYDISQK